MDNNERQKLYKAGLTDGPVKALERLYNSPLAQEARMRLELFLSNEQKRLEFIRWLVQTGQLTDQLTEDI